MAHNKQALKRARQNERIRVKNRAMRADMRTHMKAFEAAVAAKDATAVAKLARVAQKKVDKAAKQRVLHPNAASRIKARVARLSSAPPKGG
jgi:small subunit ribosomal protein S20